jgi:hypothetical protein
MSQDIHVVRKKTVGNITNWLDKKLLSVGIYAMEANCPKIICLVSTQTELIKIQMLLLESTESKGVLFA